MGVGIACHARHRAGIPYFSDSHAAGGLRGDTHCAAGNIDASTHRHAAAHRAAAHTAAAHRPAVSHAYAQPHADTVAHSRADAVSASAKSPAV